MPCGVAFPSQSGESQAYRTRLGKACAEVGGRGHGRCASVYPRGLGSRQGTGHSFLAPFKESRRKQTQRDTCGHRHTHRQTHTHTCSAESDDVDFEFGPVDQVLPVGETSVMSALATRCQDKITEALYPIEQLMTEAKVGQPGWTGGERTATPLCSGQGSTLAPSLTRQQSRRM